MKISNIYITQYSMYILHIIINKVSAYHIAQSRKIASHVSHCGSNNQINYYSDLNRCIIIYNE